MLQNPASCSFATFVAFMDRIYRPIVGSAHTDAASIAAMVLPVPLSLDHR